MNIIETKLQEFDALSIQRWTDMCHASDTRLIENSSIYKAQKDFLRTAMLEAIETVLKEAELEPVHIEGSGYGVTATEHNIVIVYNEARKDQQERHQQILKNYKTPKGNN